MVAGKFHHADHWPVRSNLFPVVLFPRADQTTMIAVVVGNCFSLSMSEGLPATIYAFLYFL
jgi:hypothetical protein